VDIDFSFRPNEGLPVTAHRRIREAGSVVWNETLGGWMVSSYALARSVLGDVENYTMKGTPVAEQLGEQAMLVNDTPLHNRMRAVWTRQVSRGAMVVRNRELQANAVRVLDRVRPRLDAGEPVDFIPLFQKFVLEFISSSFAIPFDKLDAVRRWSEMSADAPAVGMDENAEEYRTHFAVKQEVFDLILDQVADRKARFRDGEEPDDLISLMVAAEAVLGLSPEMVRDNLFNFILGALDTTEKWLGNIVVTLCNDAALVDELRANRALIEPAVDEIMRVDTVAQTIMRRVKKEGVVLGDKALKEGDFLYVMLGVANRDPAEFGNPDEFDIHRQPKPNLGFGFGFHHCLGINIAKQEAVAFVNVLLSAFPRLRVVRCDYGATWALWGPRRLELSRAPGAEAG
jgi:cytochrome P450